MIHAIDRGERFQTTIDFWAHSNRDARLFCYLFCCSGCSRLRSGHRCSPESRLRTTQHHRDSLRLLCRSLRFVQSCFCELIPYSNSQAWPHKRAVLAALEWICNKGASNWPTLTAPPGSAQVLLSRKPGSRLSQQQGQGLASATLSCARLEAVPQAQVPSKSAEFRSPCFRECRFSGHRKIDPNPQLLPRSE